jgi:hypothetical protein
MSRVKGHVSQGLCGLFPEDRWPDIERVIQEAFNANHQSQQARNGSPVQNLANLTPFSSAPQQNLIESNGVVPGMNQQLEVDPYETQTGPVYGHLLSGEQLQTRIQQGDNTNNTSDSAYYSAFNRTNDSPHGGMNFHDDFFEQLMNFPADDDIPAISSQDYPGPSSMG